MFLNKVARQKLKESLQLLKEAADEDPIKGDGQVPVEDDNITVEVDGEIVTDTTEEESSEITGGEQEDALDG